MRSQAKDLGDVPDPCNGEARGFPCARHARVFTVDVFALDFTGLLDDPDGPTHGGELDTSLLLHLAPALVQMQLAQDFELKTQEQLMAARELNLRSKELLTVSRMRMVKENAERGKALGRLNLTDKDVAKISGWIEDDARPIATGPEPG